MRLLQSSRGQPQCPSFPGCPQQLPGLSATPLPAAVAPLGSLAFSAALRSSGKRPHSQLEAGVRQRSPCLRAQHHRAASDTGSVLSWPRDPDLRGREAPAEALPLPPASLPGLQPHGCGTSAGAPVNCWRTKGLQGQRAAPRGAPWFSPSPSAVMLQQQTPSVPGSRIVSFLSRV